MCVSEPSTSKLNCEPCPTALQASGTRGAGRGSDRYDRRERGDRRRDEDPGGRGNRRKDSQQPKVVPFKDKFMVITCALEIKLEEQVLTDDGKH